MCDINDQITKYVLAFKGTRTLYLIPIFTYT